MGNNITYTNQIKSINQAPGNKIKNIDKLLLEDEDTYEYDRKIDEIIENNKDNVIIQYENNIGLLVNEKIINNNVTIMINKTGILYKSTLFLSVTSFIKKIINKQVDESCLNKIIFRYKNIQINWSSNEIQNIRAGQKLAKNSQQGDSAKGLEQESFIGKIYKYIKNRYEIDNILKNHRDSVLVQYENNIGILITEDIIQNMKFEDNETKKRAGILYDRTLFLSVVSFVRNFSNTVEEKPNRDNVTFIYKNLELSWISPQIQNIRSLKGSLLANIHKYMTSNLIYL